jgi:hypothetical protein
MNKLALLSLAVTSSLLCSAQTDSRIFYSQLMLVISDLEKDFEYLKGDEISKQEGITFYETIRSLEGTKDNMIVVDAATSQFQAVIIDSSSEEGSKLILDAWKDKLASALTGMFSPAVAFQSKDVHTNGFQFLSEKIVVLLLRHKEDNGSYWINLVIKPKT